MDSDLEKIDKLFWGVVDQGDALCDRLESAVKDCRQRLRKMALDKSNDLKKQLQDQESSFTGIAVPSDVIKMTLTFDPQAVSRIEQELSQLGQLLVEQDAKLQDVKLRFHHNHSRNVKLTNDCQTAEVTPDNFGDVMSCESMLTDMLYQVQVDEINTGKRNAVLGVVTKSPDNIPCLDDWRGFRAASVWVSGGVVQTFRTRKDIDRPALCDVPTGTKLGLAVRGDQSLQLFIDNVCQGVVANVRSTCYFYLYLGYRCTKVTALPVCPV